MISQTIVLQKIEERIKARKAGDYRLADKNREELSIKGIDIKDKNDNTEWEYK